MWEDTTRKYFFSFIDENFKDWLVDEDSGSSSLLVDWARTSASKFLGVLLTSLATIHCHLTIYKVKVDWKSLAFFISEQDNLALAIGLQVELQFIGVIGLSTIWEDLFRRTKFFDSWDRILVEFAIFDSEFFDQWEGSLVVKTVRWVRNIW